MPSSGQAFDDDLSESSVAVVGTIDLELVEKLKAQIASPNVKQRLNRQTELVWNTDCDAVVSDFETISS
jgi:hypothetical protein